MRRPGTAPAPHGFSLLEVLITLAVTAVALTALVQLQIELQRSGALARERSAAIALAASRLERLRTAARRTGSAGLDGPASESLRRHGTRYRLTVTLDHSATPAVADITVTWADSGGRRRSVRLASLIDPASAADSGAAVASRATARRR